MLLARIPCLRDRDVGWTSSGTGCCYTHGGLTRTRARVGIVTHNDDATVNSVDPDVIRASRCLNVTTADQFIVPLPMLVTAKEVEPEADPTG